MNLQEDLMISKDLSLVSQQFNFNVNDVPPVGTDKFIMKKNLFAKKNNELLYFVKFRNI